MFATMRSACLAAVVLAHAMASAVAARSLHQAPTPTITSTAEELTSAISTGEKYILISNHLNLTSYVSGAVPVGVAPTNGTTLGSVASVELLGGGGCLGQDGEDLPCILVVSKPLMEVGHSMMMVNLQILLDFYAPSFENRELLSVSGSSGNLYMLGVLLGASLTTPMDPVGFKTSGNGSVYAEGCAFVQLGCWTGSDGCAPAFDVGGGSASFLESSFFYLMGSFNTGIMDITDAGAQGLRLAGGSAMNVTAPSGYFVHEAAEGSASLVYTNVLAETYDDLPPTGVLTPNPLSADVSEGGIFLTFNDTFVTGLLTTLQGGAAKGGTPAGIQSVIGFEQVSNMSTLIEAFF